MFKLHTYALLCIIIEYEKLSILYYTYRFCFSLFIVYVPMYSSTDGISEIVRKYYQPIMELSYRYSCRYNVIPVVYGGANYSEFAPPNSYVNALDFESPKELAAYLKYLSQDLQRYQSFLQWKKYYRVNAGTKRAVCNLCEVLHKQKKSKIYSDLSDWYAKDQCSIQASLNDANKYATKHTLMNRGRKQRPDYKTETQKHW